MDLEPYFPPQENDNTVLPRPAAGTVFGACGRIAQLVFSHAFA